MFHSFLSTIVNMKRSGFHHNFIIFFSGNFMKTIRSINIGYIQENTQNRQIQIIWQYTEFIWGKLTQKLSRWWTYSYNGKRYLFADFEWTIKWITFLTPHKIFGLPCMICPIPKLKRFRDIQIYVKTDIRRAWNNYHIFL